MNGDGDFGRQLAMRAISLFKIDLDAVFVDDKVLDNDGQDLAFHLFHAFRRQIDAIVLQDESQSILRGRAAAFFRTPEQSG